MTHVPSTGLLAGICAASALLLAGCLPKPPAAPPPPTPTTTPPPPPDAVELSPELCARLEQEEQPYDFGELVDDEGFAFPLKSIRRSEPTYPVEELKAGITGNIVAELVIGPDGFVERVKVVDGVANFVKSAKAAMRQWVYQPGSCNGERFRYRVRVTLDYKIDSGSHVH